MKIYAVDDEYIALEMLRRSISRVNPGAELYCFEDPSELLKKAVNEIPDVVFLDIHMAGMDGLELAKRLRAVSPTVNLIFTTGFEEHALEAFNMLASGYLLKPIGDENIRAQLENLRYPVKDERRQIFAQCFGNFTFFVNGAPVNFSRSKSKELLAYLIDRHGALVTRREAVSVLFEDECYSRSIQKYLSAIIWHLEKDLENYGAKHIFFRSRGGCYIDKTAFECDMYEYERENPRYKYTGEYMEQYSWGELFKSQHCSFE